MTENKRGKPAKRQGPSGESGVSGGLVKLYYRIGEVAHIVGVAPHVLRYWESEFPTLKPQKSNHGQRVYTKRDVQKLLLIKHLLKEQGLTIAGARKQLRVQRVMPGAEGASSDTHRTPSADASAPNSDASAPSADAAPSALALDPLSDALSRSALPSAPGAVGVADQGAAQRPPGPSSKSMRQALLSVRRELIDWLADLG